MPDCFEKGRGVVQYYRQLKDEYPAFIDKILKVGFGREMVKIVRHVEFPLRAVCYHAGANNSAEDVKQLYAIVRF